MASKIFVNLPVNNLEKTIAFFTSLGFSFNPQFTDDKATCMVISDHIFAMLMTADRFRDFTSKEICDSSRFTEVILSLDAESREAVNGIVDKALASGATEPRPTQDYGWMYLRGFQDIDGHLWEIAFMDESAMPAQMG